MRRWVLAPLLALALPARAATPSVREVERLIGEWRIEQATAALAELEKRSPEDPEVLALDGNLKFLHGEYHEAVLALDRALAHHGHGEPSDEVRGLRELAAATAEATRGYAEARSPGGHFVIRYAPGRDELLLGYAFEALEAAYRAIGEKDFGDAPTEPVRVEIYPEVADLAKVSTLTLKEIETSGTIALCKFNRLMIVTPRALGRGYPWLDTLAHEYTHFVVSRASHNTVPIWFHEGLAKYEERRWRSEAGGGMTATMEHLLATALRGGRRLITFDEMYPSMAKLPSQADTALAFAEVFTVVEYLLEQKGWKGVRQVIDRMREGKGDARAVADVLGVSFGEFQESWRGWLKAKKLKTHPGLVPSSLKFVAAAAKKGKTPPPSEADDVQEIGEERARKLARLGGMLRARGRLAPAAMEYQKAEALVGPGHPQVANRLARTWLDLGELDKAIAAAQPAFDLYPDLAAPAATIGEAYLRKKEPEQARPYLEAAIRVSPFDPAPHCALATIYRASDAKRAEREQAACDALEGG